MPLLLLHRSVALGLLAVWLAPGAGALALELHVALEHGRGRAAHSSEASVPSTDDLALGLAHGHHHATAEPEHEHRGTMSGTPGLGSPTRTGAVVQTEVLPAPFPAPRAVVGGASRRAPPGPLFLAHRSLLL